MTIASEITRIQNNIANTYTALSDKGATMPATQNSANLATTVASIPAGGGDTVTAVNYTGSAITVGDKVWLNEKANVSANAVAVNNTSGTYIMDATGNFVYYSQSSYKYKYDISAGTSTKIANAISSDSLGSQPFYYDEYNNLYCLQNCLNASGITDIGMMCNQDDYAIKYTTGSSTAFTLYKVDKQNNFNVTHSWYVSSNSDDLIYHRTYTIIGNKLYTKGSSYDGKIGTINNESSSITMSARTDNFKDYDIIHSTSDNKIAIAVKIKSNNLTYGWREVKLINIYSNYTLGSAFVSSNSELNNLLALSPIYFTFNRVTGILCISKYDNNSIYGVFKYENGDFTTISLSLNNTSGQTWQSNYVISVSNDLSRVEFGNILFNLQQTADGTYRAIPYSYAMGQQTLTGVANENAANGASFEATTIVPDV